MSDAPAPVDPADTDAAVEQATQTSMHGCPMTEIGGQRVLYPALDQYLQVATTLLGEGFEMCADLTAVDYLLMPERALPAGVTAERFEVVVNLLSLSKRERLRLRVQVPGDEPSIASLFDLYPGSEAMEREVYDMFGIVFQNHPDLTRILMPEDWDGFPLRKDYAQGKIPVQFSADMTDARALIAEAHAAGGRP